MSPEKNEFNGYWAIILGASSGFGLASAKKLLSKGMNLVLIYRATATQDRIFKQEITTINTAFLGKTLFLNINALDENERQSFFNQHSASLGKKSVKLLLHSIARGNLKPLIDVNSAIDPSSLLSQSDIQMTTYAMGTSLLDWVKDLHQNQLFAEDSRVIGLTSEGAHKYWNGYAAVSIAKSALESLAKYMAVEFACFGIRTNIIQAGITATPSLKRIPNSEKLIEIAKNRNPLGRATTPEDVANIVYLMCKTESAWINGALIHVDGGEHCL